MSRVIPALTYSRAMAGQSQGCRKHQCAGRDRCRPSRGWLRGYLDLASPELMDQIAVELKPYVAATEVGPQTSRVTRRGERCCYRPLSELRTLVAHPTILGTLDLSLGDHCSTFQIDLTQLVDIGPGSRRK